MLAAPNAIPAAMIVACPCVKPSPSAMINTLLFTLQRVCCGTYSTNRGTGMSRPTNGHAPSAVRPSGISVLTISATE